MTNGSQIEDSTPNSARNGIFAGGAPQLNQPQASYGDTYDDMQPPKDEVGLKRQREKLANEPLKDRGLAKRWAFIRGPQGFNDVVYHKKWYRWNGKYWDDGSGAKSSASTEDQLIADIQRELPEYLKRHEPQNEKRDAAIGFLNTNEFASKVLKAARTELAPAVPEFNGEACEPYLNVENGVLNLDTGELIDHSTKRARDLGFTKVAPVKYDKKATCEGYDRYISNSMCGKDAPTTIDDQAHIDESHRHDGLFLLGKPQKVIELWIGVSNTGKSTKSEIHSAILGEFYHAGNTEALEKGKHTQARAALEGKRVAVFTELDGVELDMGFVKKLSSGSDPIQAHGMGVNDKEFRPSATQLWMVNVVGYAGFFIPPDPATWDRIEVLTFPHARLPHQIKQARDSGVVEKIKADERSGILNRMLKGYQDYKRQGINPTARNVAAKAQLRSQCTRRNTTALRIKDCLEAHAAKFPRGFERAPRAPDGTVLGTDGMLLTHARIRHLDGTHEVCAITTAGFKEILEKDIRIGPLSETFQSSREFRSAKTEALDMLGWEPMSVYLVDDPSRQVYAPRDGILKNDAEARDEFLKLARHLIIYRDVQASIEADLGLRPGGALLSLVGHCVSKTPTEDLRLYSAWLKGKYGVLLPVVEPTPTSDSAHSSD